MKKIMLTAVHQKDHIFYMLKADPREIVPLIERCEAKEVQESQRPWSKQKVKEISEYVMGSLSLEKQKFKVAGLIPNAPIINLIGAFEILYDENDNPYILFPETEEERKRFAGTIQLIDGQHRVLAFAPDLRDPMFSDDIPYEMIFSTFYKLTEDEKKELFMVTNEKQTKIESNLLRLMRKALSLLGHTEEYFDLVCKLNTEEISPLKGRLMIGAKKITRGYKESQFSKILEESSVYDRLEAENFNDLNSKCKLLSIYFKAWERVYEVSFQRPSKSTLTKIGGIRYIMFLLPSILDILKKEKLSPSEKVFMGMIEQLPVATGISDVFTDPAYSIAFRAGSAIQKMAKEHGELLIKYLAKDEKEFDLSKGFK